MNQYRHWRKFVEQRRRELGATHPCAAPSSSRRRCPKHKSPIGLTGLCASCQRELYQQLAVEYTNREEMTTMHDTTPTPAATEIAGQLGLFDIDLTPERVETVHDETGEALDDAA